MDAPLGGALIALWWRRSQESLALGGAGAVVICTALLPLAWLVGEAWSAGAAAFDLLGQAPWRLFLRSILVSAGVTAVALVIGVPLGLLVARSDLPGRRLLWWLHAFPLFVPPFLIALGWFHLLGRGGLVGSEATAAFLFNEAGLIGVLGLAFAPIVTSLVALAAAGLDASLEESARVLARPWRVMTRIVLPVTARAAGLGAIVVFALAISELGAPLFLRVEVYPAAVFARLGGIAPSPGEACVLALPLVAVSLVLSWMEGRSTRGRPFATAGVRGLSRSPLPLGRWRVPLGVLAWLVAALALLPLVALFARAGFAEAWPWLGAAPWNSLFAAVCAATTIVAVAIVIGQALARHNRAATWLDRVALLGFLTPAPVLGVALIAVWNHSATQAIYTSAAILVLGFVARYAVLGLRVVAAAAAQNPAAWSEAAVCSGAGWARRTVRIFVPVNARAIAAAWLLVLIFCLRDLDTAVLFYPPGGEPLTVRIFTLEANGPAPVVAALAVVQVSMTALLLCAGALLVRPRGSR